MKPMLHRALLPGLSALLASSLIAADPPAGMKTTRPAFTAGSDGEFAFDTGVLRGKLHAKGKSLGLTSVTHVPSGKRLDRSNGLLSHYRVFTKGVRYGGGAWDWPSQATLRDDGTVEVRWPAAQDRPFEMQALYRWRAPNILDLETSVKPARDLAGFESFLASYFHEGFSNAAVSATSPNNPSQAFVPARKSLGDWLMFPRDSAVLPLMTDGRWKLEPNPVNWTILPALTKPIGLRREPASGLTAILMSPAQDCIAIALPHQTEPHYSLYLSLFGRDLRAGQPARARTRLLIASAPSEQDILAQYAAYLATLDSP